MVIDKTITIDVAMNTGLALIVMAISLLCHSGG